MSEQNLRATLLAISLRSDELAFKKLYYEYFNRLYYFSLPITKSTEIAEEIVHDTFIGLWNNRSRLMQIENFKVYIYTAVRNRSINANSRLKIHEHMTLEDADLKFHADSQQADDKLVAEELAQLLHKSLEKLPAQSRMIFRLVREEGLKHKEAAEVMNLTVKSIEYHMGNVLKKLWETTSDYYNTSLNTFAKKKRRDI